MAEGHMLANASASRAEDCLALRRVQHAVVDLRLINQAGKEIVVVRVASDPELRAQRQPSRNSHTVAELAVHIGFDANITAASPQVTPSAESCVSYRRPF